jgi:hypothetical protein
MHSLYFVPVSSAEGCSRCECALIEHWIYDMTLVAPYASDLIGFPTGRDDSFSNKTLHYDTLQRNKFAGKDYSIVLICTLLW